ncbi:EAL domain-containing protein [Rhodovulum sulfidophilum]|uniref:EAL domain-containing protein n=1 Tax=Rhodovulum sulfidophilum TaxID=35806 RepID=A0ABS1RT42_RHOSU|nr:EAL domain-containing protein [Rhodovulum sulfidophilum]MBL3609241.1 EAL domain-containing protein [Rhodovulum sulfidophilum]MCE8455665.1 EAL domain-containing protein [Rhodovulum sulfidophilum]
MENDLRQPVAQRLRDSGARRGRIASVLRGGESSILNGLGLAAATFLTLILGLGALSLGQIGSVTAVSLEMRDVALPKLLAVNEIEIALDAHALLARRRVQVTDFRQAADIDREMRRAAARFLTGIERLDQLTLGARALEVEQSLEAAWLEYLAALDRVGRLYERGALADAEAAMQDSVRVAEADVRRSVSDLVDVVQAEAAGISAAAEREWQRARVLTLGALLAGLAATLLTMRWVVRRVSRPLLAISAAMRRLNRGEDAAILPVLPGRTDEIGILAEAAAAFRDSVLEARALAADLELQREILAASVRNMPLGLCMLDDLGRVAVSNRALAEIFDLSPADCAPGVAQRDLLDRLAARVDRGRKSAGEFSTGIAATVARGDQMTETWQLMAGGSVSVIIQPTPDGWMMIAEDITERVSHEANIRHLARHDPLTGLPNRRAFSEEIDRAIAEAGAECPAAVLFVDLDRFKNVNDTLGHGIGDALLRQVAARLSWAVRDADTVARFGGDEFAVIQRGCVQPEGARGLGERIIALLFSPFEIEGNSLRIGGSVGVALAPGDGDCVADVLRNADLALYAAKAAGRGQCLFFDPEMNARQRALQKLEHDLRQAVLSDAFVMEYQPLFDIASGDLVGAEALMRWIDPVRGRVSPAEFVPMAEELGLIVPLGARALEMACADAATWPAHLKVAVNLSPVQVHRVGVIEDVRAALAASGLDPRRLEVEITEGVLLDHGPEVLGTLDALHEMGVQIALDDFGTGYSSLGYLRALRLDKVKIDISFVRELENDPSAAAIVRAVCSLCASLDIGVTAEGVETAEQLASVAAAGCIEAQGFYLGRPGAAEIIAGLAGGALQGGRGVA